MDGSASEPSSLLQLRSGAALPPTFLRLLPYAPSRRNLQRTNCSLIIAASFLLPVTVSLLGRGNLTPKHFYRYWQCFEERPAFWLHKHSFYSQQILIFHTFLYICTLRTHNGPVMSIRPSICLFVLFDNRGDLNRIWMNGFLASEDLAFLNLTPSSSPSSYNGLNSSIRFPISCQSTY